MPFDQFQRYEPVRRILSAFSDHSGEPLDILDVGGGDGPLRSLLPEARIVIADPGEKALQDIICRGEALPFRGGSFDVAVCIDTLEHIAAESRPRLLGEMARVAPSLGIVAAPFDSSQNRSAEEAVRRCHQAVYKEEDPWLAEHVEHGLPDLAETRRLLEESYGDVSAAPSGHLPDWRHLMALNMLLLALPESHPLYLELNRMVNDRFYGASRRDPAYRTVLVASSAGFDWLDAEEINEANEDSAALWAESFGLLARRLTTAIRDRMAVIEQGESHVRELEVLLSEKDKAVTEGRLFAEKLEGEIVESRQSYQELEEGYSGLERQVEDLLQHGKEIESYVRHVETEFKKAASLYEEAAGQAAGLAGELEGERKTRSEIESRSAVMAARLAELESRYPERLRRFLQERFARG